MISAIRSAACPSPNAVCFFDIASIIMGLASYGLMMLGVGTILTILLSTLVYVVMLALLKDPIIQDAKILLIKIRA